MAHAGAGSKNHPRRRRTRHTITGKVTHCDSHPSSHPLPKADEAQPHSEAIPGVTLRLRCNQENRVSAGYSCELLQRCLIAHGEVGPTCRGDLAIAFQNRRPVGQRYLDQRNRATTSLQKCRFAIRRPQIPYPVAALHRSQV